MFFVHSMLDILGSDRYFQYFHCVTLQGSDSVRFGIATDNTAILAINIYTMGWRGVTKNIHLITTTGGFWANVCMSHFRLSERSIQLPTNRPSSVKEEDVLPLMGMDSLKDNLYVHFPGFSEDTAESAWLVRKSPDGSYEYLDPFNVVLSLW